MPRRLLLLLALLLGAPVPASAGMHGTKATSKAPTKPRSKQRAERLRRLEEKNPDGVGQVLQRRVRGRGKGEPAIRLPRRVRWYGPTEGLPIQTAGFRLRLPGGEKLILRPVPNVDAALRATATATRHGGPRVLGKTRVRFRDGEGDALVMELVAPTLPPAEWRSLGLRPEHVRRLEAALIPIAQNMPGVWTKVVALEPLGPTAYRLRLRNSVEWGRKRQSEGLARRAVKEALYRWLGEASVAPESPATEIETASPALAY